MALCKRDHNAFTKDPKASNKFFSVYTGEYKGATLVHIVLDSANVYNFDLYIRMYTEHLEAEIAYEGYTKRPNSRQFQVKNAELLRYSSLCQLNPKLGRTECAFLVTCPDMIW